MTQEHLPLKLSLCAIVKDEEKSLPDCLKSVRGIVDEMIILDTGSSDRTPEIATEFGAKVYYSEWKNDFSIARNEALKYVTGDWVLVLDADERLHPAIVAPIRLSLNNPNLLVINLIRQEIGASQTPYSLTSRLFRRHPAIKFSRPYHALIDDSVIQLLKKEPHWQIASLADVAVIHYGYQPGEIAAKDKLKRAKAAMESYLNTAQEDAYTLNKLGALYVQSGEIQKGIELLEKGLKDLNADPNIVYELNYHLANAYNRLEDVNKAVIYYQAAIAQDILPQLKIGAYNNLGGILQAAGEYAMAQKTFAATVVIDPTFVMGYYNLGMALKAQGNYKDAITAYEQAIKLKPDYTEAYQNLGVVWLKCGRVPEGLEHFGKAIALWERTNLVEAQRLRQSLKQMGFEAPKINVDSLIQAPANS